MTFFTRAATTALAGCVIFGFASAAFATPARTQIQEGSLQAHIALVDAVKRAGVSVVINHDHCQQVAGINGFYDGKNRLLVICNDKYIPRLNEHPEWTANDFDTLRHEAQHFIQDCMVGTNHDHWMNNVYKNPVALGDTILGQSRMNRLTRLYREHGASDHILRLEYEAFAVARMNVPLEQSQDVQKYCMGG